MPKCTRAALARSSKPIGERVTTLRLTRKAPYKVKNPEAPAVRREAEEEWR
jgi:hypothetical protein